MTMRRIETAHPIEVRWGDRVGQGNRTTAGTHSLHQLGFWSAALSAVFSVLWFITFKLQDVIASVPDWRDAHAYAVAFAPLRQLYIYPSLLLAMTFIVMLACVHRFAPEEKKIWSLIGLAIGIVYSTMATVNYNIQAVAVRQTLLHGETQGVTMFLPDNPYSVFNALANSYVYNALAMAFVAPVFAGGRLEGWTRRLFLAQVLTAVGQIGWSMFDLSTTVFIVLSLTWVIGAPAAFVLLAVLFKRAARQPAI